MAEYIRHRLLNSFICNCLFSLVFIGSAVRKRRYNQYQTVLHIIKSDFAFFFIVFSVLLKVGIYLVNKSVAGCLVWRAPMLKPA